MERNPRSHCPVSLALEAIGDKWSLLILRDLIMRGKTRYQEFLNSEEGISTNILADRLVRLERQGLISKSDNPGDKRQFRYSPTQKGLDLLPVIFEMARWSVKYDLHTDTASRFLKRMRAGKKGLMRQILSQLKESYGRDSSRHLGFARKSQAWSPLGLGSPGCLDTPSANSGNHRRHAGRHRL